MRIGSLGHATGRPAAAVAAAAAMGLVAASPAAGYIGPSPNPTPGSNEYGSWR